MPEFVNTPNFYQDSDILSKINLPKEESALQVQRTLQETQKIQKSISNLEDSEEKRKKETKKHIKKKNNDFKKRVSSRHSFFLIESVHKITHFWTLSFFALFFKKTIHFMFINP
ncbi:TPA: hypothetical protein NZ964_003016 [Enterococcus faecium]|uniref:hypothetical protein n=1 Tax=Enterococcus TaxID=1350 RepID=UPI000252F3C6|nr:MULTISPECIES: hypothetical protein [Enterococcus]AFC65002.1 hypothetical protein EFAU004_p1056 [Enterococcus faecium Aus0004]EJE4565320.1 hypothetical protein [Enterococcus faecium]MBJ1247968.1 hypothetical protein [Enterococcus faecium]MBJ8174655.1 hypothetical protein [Enterococcus faecium]MBQ1087290.1 hypothetical protein [Enterococcus faecium]